MSHQQRSPHQHYLDIPGVGELWGCSDDTVRRMIARGQLKAVRIGRLIRIRPEDLRKAEKPVTRLSVGGDVA